MDCVAALVSQLQWLANVSMATVSDMCPIDFYIVLYLLIFLIVMPFVLPSFTLMLHNMVVIYGHAYVWYYGLSNTPTEDKGWDQVRVFMPNAIRSYCRLFHGIEIEGIENIPSEGGALLVGYHGLLPVDLVYLVSELIRTTGRHARLVVDRQVLNLPYLRLEMRILKAISGTIETCSNVLKDGHLLLITPGGDYECLFNDNNYELLWRNRLGYAKVAIEAKAPIIPVFTVNIGEAYRTVSIGRSWLKSLYPKWRLLGFIFIYGGLPVKLRIIVGKPIPYDPALTPEELNQKVKMSMEQMIKDNQRLPGSMRMALMDRFKCQKKVKGT